MITITLYDKKMKPVYDALKPYNLLDPIVHEGSLNKDIPTAWSKLLLIKNYWKDGDWILWVDADYVLLKPIDFDRLLKTDKDMVLAHNWDQKEYNTGLWFLKCNDWTKQLLESLEVIKHPRWEQEALKRKIGIDTEHVLPLPWKIYNCFPWYYNKQKTKGVHFFGPKKLMAIIKFFAEYEK